ncbi:MAG: FxsB family radical SAM/SPASM domain protein [Dactylosporangium sp.]|nr:FxsB family radical SAM/SPASM domain protein [Dactylosporangium sp.]
MREFVLKVHQRCNLACDYCYVYTMADQSWHDRPILMSREIWSAAATAIAQHVTTHDLSEVQVILHGGEPLLAGPETIVAVTTAIRTALRGTAVARMAVQTNGTLLDEATLRVLDRNDIRVGISLDGDRADNDRHRHYGDGRGSYLEIDRALRLLGSPRYRSAFSGILATIDPETSPVACYEALLKYAPPALDFLLPHANWSTPRPARAELAHPFGDWLVAVFDRWYDAPSQETRIRFFEEIMNMVFGCASRSEDIGLSPAVVAVVETDGAIEQVDSLKSAYAGAASTGLSVLTDTFDAALEHPGIVARQLGPAALSPRCWPCELHPICGGGHYPHRYRAGSGFRNPSVYCADLRRLISHIQHRVLTDLNDRGQDSAAHIGGGSMSELARLPLIASSVSG